MMVSMVLCLGVSSAVAFQMPSAPPASTALHAFGGVKKTLKSLAFDPSEQLGAQA